MRFLLLNGAEDSYWGIFLAEVVAPLGILSIAPAVHGMPVGDDELDGLIVIDATNVEQVEKLVAGLRTENPARRIVVMTASPTWQRARAAFEAGAIDYLPKTLPADELRALFEDILRRPLPPWPV